MGAKARELHQELLNLELKALIMGTGAGGNFGLLVMHALHSMKSMVVFGCPHYGAKTKSTYSSYDELKNANEKNKHIIPIRLCQDWPPQPTDDENDMGKIQNEFVFKPSLNYLDWSNKSWNAAQCAKEVKRAYEIEHGGYGIEHDV